MKHTFILISILFPLLTYSQIKIFSGVNEGSYNRIANDIKKICTQDIEVVPTGGSAENFKLLKENKGANIALLQYDVLLYKATENKQNTEGIEIIFPIDNEEIHLITYKGSGIEKLSDLEGKIVATGTKGQGTYITSKLINKQTNIKWIDEEMCFNDAFMGLLVGTIDAFFFVGAVPVTKLKNLSPDFSNIISLISVKSTELDKIYTGTRINAYKYKWSKKHIETYAIPSVIAINTKGMKAEDKEKINQILLQIKKKLPQLKETGHPKWRRVEPDFKNLKWKIYEKSAEIFN